MMLRCFIFISCLLACNCIYGQDTIKVRRERTVPFTPGFKSKSVRYPFQAINNAIQGKVILLFDVDSTCAIVNRRVAKGLGFGCDEASLEMLDEHEADLKAGHPSGCGLIKDYMMPVTFKIK